MPVMSTVGDPSREREIFTLVVPESECIESLVKTNCYHTVLVYIPDLFKFMFYWLPLQLKFFSFVHRKAEYSPEVVQQQCLPFVGQFSQFISVKYFLINKTEICSPSAFNQVVSSIILTLLTYTN